MGTNGFFNLAELFDFTKRVVDILGEEYEARDTDTGGEDLEAMVMALIPMRLELRVSSDY